MASTLENALRLVKPGEMVVSITDILDKLGNKITAEEKEQLLIAMLSPRREKVQPGDLITTDLANQILADIADLQVRVAYLESSDHSSGLVINAFDPAADVHVGDRLTIKGAGFSVPPERNIVLVGNTPVQSFNTVASDPYNLVFEVPDPKLPLIDPISISVTNDQGAKASKNLRLLPAVSIPQGRIEVPYKIAPTLPTSGQGTPGTFATGEWIFGFDLSTIVSGTGVYRVTPSVTAAGWRAELLADGQNTLHPDNLFVIMDSNTHPLRIRLTVPSGAAVPTSGTLRIDVVETTPNTKVTQGNQTVDLAIGSPIPLPDNRIRLSLLEAQNAVIRDGRVLVVRSDFDPGAIAFNALVTQSGTYTPTASYTNSNGWTTTEVSPGFVVATTPPTGTPANGGFTIFLKAGADASPTDLILTLTRTEGGSARFYVGIGLQ
jgi:hypothetical protein